MTEDNHKGRVRYVGVDPEHKYVWQLPGLAVQRVHGGLAEALVARANRSPKYAAVMNKFGGRSRKGMLKRVLLRTTTLNSQAAV